MTYPVPKIYQCPICDAPIRWKKTLDGKRWYAVTFNERTGSVSSVPHKIQCFPRIEEIESL